MIVPLNLKLTHWTVQDARTDPRAMFLVLLTLTRETRLEKTRLDLGKVMLVDPVEPEISPEELLIVLQTIRAYLATQPIQEPRPIHVRLSAPPETSDDD